MENKKNENKNLKENSNDKKVNVIKIVGIVIGVVALFTLVFFTSTQREGKELKDYVTDTTASEYFELKNGSEKAIILLASPSCTWCQKYKPVISKVSADYELPVYYVNTSSLTSDEYDDVYASSPSISSSGSGYIGTPTTLLVQNGEEVDYIEGYVAYSDVVSFLQDNGVIQ